MSKKSDAQSTRSVFLLSVGGTASARNFGGIRLGVCWIELGEPGGLAHPSCSPDFEVMLTSPIGACLLSRRGSDFLLHVQTEKTESV